MTILSSTSPGKSGLASNIVFTREDPATGATAADRLAAFAAARYREMSQSLPSPVFHVSRAVEIEGHPAQEIIVSWQNGAVRVSQWVVFLEGRDGQVLTGTATAAESEFNTSSPLFADLFTQAARQL